MDKLKMHTPDLAEENYKKLAALFPDAVTETIDENGNVVRAIDKDVLMQEINAQVVDDGQERYQFTWPDKRKSLVLANAPIAKTLRFEKEKSVGRDGTLGGTDSENIYIEGDNLDALKLLQETYLGKVKMIYIDPPYNTGSDAFIYDDDFDVTSEEFSDVSGQHDDDGNILFDMRINNESNGRFHTDWLNMLYPRLRVAKDLLSDDGVIFISIDDNEVENLLKIGNEIFGDDNFVNIVTVKTKVGGVSGSSEGKSLKDATEFISIWAKNKSSLSFEPVYIKTKLFDKIRSYEEEGKSWKYTSVVAELSDKELIFEDSKRGMKFYGYRTLRTASIQSFAKEKGITKEDVYNHYADRIFRTTNAQSSVRQTVMKETEGYDYPMFGLEYTPTKGKNEGQVVEILYKGEKRGMMMFLSDAVEKKDGEYFYLDKITSLWDDIDYNNLSKEGNIEFPNGKKPIKLLQRIINLSTSDDDLVLDFFSGSASTAHAVLQANYEKEKHLHFILVQLPEKTDKKSEAFKAGYKTICDIGEERIRRAGKKIKEETGADIDYGFRCFKVDSSNMKDVYYRPADIGQMNLDQFTDNIKEDRTPDDLLIQVMLDLGVLLSSKVEETEIAGKKVFSVADGYLIACFDKNVTEDVVTAIAKQKPFYAVFRDSSMASDSVAANFEQIFDTYSPQTVRKVL
jgi:adenine-specific DNA-methyltransferase